MPRKKILFDAFKLSLDITASNKVVIDSIKDNAFGILFQSTYCQLLYTYCYPEKFRHFAINQDTQFVHLYRPLFL